MKSVFFRVCSLYLLAYFSTATLYAFDGNITLSNSVGIKIIIPKTEEGFSFGTIFINDKQIEKSLLKGMMLFKHTKANKDIWLFASEAVKINNNKYKFLGNGLIDNVQVSFEVSIEIPENIKAVNITYNFEVDKNLKDIEACLTFNNEFIHDWKCHMYPWVADSRYIQRDPLSWPGIPSLIMYNDDRSIGLMWGIDPNSDYLNPTNWRGDFGLYFINGTVPAQYRIGGKKLLKGIEYDCPMQIILSDEKDPDQLITNLVQSWMKNSNYKIEDLFVRSNDEALKLFMYGRKNTSLWYPGKGYRLEIGDPSSAFIYIGEQGLSAYFDYLLYELSGDDLWRDRAFQQMDFILKGQNQNVEDPIYGYIHTAYSLIEEGPAGKGFNSYDRGSNLGYKVDLNVYLGLYMLKLWERVKMNEGLDNSEWYKSAINAIDWAINQQNSDGGLPQKLSFVPFEYRDGNEWMGTGQLEFVEFRNPGEKSISSTSGRALPALRNIYNITGIDRYKRVMKEIEDYTLKSFQNKYLFNSHHPDLPPHTLEEASIWGICEYWLYRYEETKNEEYLKHAIANAHLSITWKCPKQLSWVDNPTQLGSVEQQYFLQYSVYCYQNRQVECLNKLFKYTGNKLYKKLEERITQNVYWTQIAEGDLMGATHEAIADPWLAREEDNLNEEVNAIVGEISNKDKQKSHLNKTGFNETGTIYMSEQSLDLLIQVVDMYRIGEFVCNDKNVENKSYPSGDTYYSEDIKNKTMTSLRVTPSAGSIVSKVKTWDDGNMSWILGKSSEPESQIVHKIHSLIPKQIYKVIVDGKEFGSFTADSNGVVEFELKTVFEKNVFVELVEGK